MDKVDLDWTNLDFGYKKTDYNIRSFFKNNKWSKPKEYTDDNINLHIASTCLHYGQEAFEGMKVFKGKNGEARLFRWDQNAKRMINSANGVLMQPVPKKLFFDSIEKAIKLNSKYIPPYKTGSSLYVRPLLIGSGPELGVKPSKEYVFLVFVSPVGPYFKKGFTPIDVLLIKNHDRAAPEGTGQIKVGGNYAGSIIDSEKAHKEGYSSTMYLDSKEKKYIDECGPANFFGIKGKTYVTPKSNSILPSITNNSLMQLAKDMGLKVENRQIPLKELEEFDEAGACGTAAVISPINKIVDNVTGKTYQFAKNGKAGPISTKLFNKLQNIQYGDEEDIHNWITTIKI